ncbi:MAG: TRAP transporter large permease subunit [Desulfobacterales bacterium]|nr:TRAP transporter large permease subunit [Desulfobacterales bacterium]
MEPGIVIAIIFISLFLLLVLGVPVAFSLFALSMVIAIVMQGPRLLMVSYMSTYSTMISDILLAIPLFIFMATILEFSDVVSDLVDAAYKWSGHFRGGLVVATLFVAMMIDAMSGLGATATVTLGLLALPQLLKKGYHKTLVLGAIPAGGSLGPVIPPSIVMIILASLTRLSIGKLFIGGILPGLLITFLWSCYVAVLSFVKPDMTPSTAPEDLASWREKFASLKSIIAPIALIILVLGAIYTGVVTPTEAGAMGAAGAFVCAAINRKLTWSNMKNAAIRATLTNGLVMWLLCAGASFAAIMQITGLSAFIQGTVLGISDNPMVIVGLMLIVAIFLGFFMDAGANLMICTPVFWPIVEALPIDPIWWGVTFVLALCVGYITPPFGMNLFYLKGIAPEGITIGDIYKSSIPFSIVYFVGIILVMIFPVIVTWLPSLMMK